MAEAAKAKPAAVAKKPRLATWKELSEFTSTYSGETASYRYKNAQGECISLRHFYCLSFPVPGPFPSVFLSLDL